MFGKMPRVSTGSCPRYPWPPLQHPQTAQQPGKQSSHESIRPGAEGGGQSGARASLTTSTLTTASEFCRVQRGDREGESHVTCAQAAAPRPAHTHMHTHKALDMQTPSQRQWMQGPTSAPHAGMSREEGWLRGLLLGHASWPDGMGYVLGPAGKGMDCDPGDVSGNVCWLGWLSLGCPGQGLVHTCVYVCKGPAVMLGLCVISTLRYMCHRNLARYGCSCTRILCMCENACVHVCIHIHVCGHMYVCVCVCSCMHVHLPVCMCVCTCVYVCAFVCICVCMRAYVGLHTHAHTLGIPCPCAPGPPHR